MNAATTRPRSGSRSTPQSQGINVPVYIDATMARVGRALTFVQTMGAFDALTTPSVTV